MDVYSFVYTRRLKGTVITTHVMATVAIVLKTTKKLNNNEYSVAVRVTHDREPRYFPISTLVTNQSLKFRCTKEQWRPAEKEDNGLGRFRKSVEGYRELNEILQAKLKQAQAVLSEYERLCIPFSFERFEQDLKRSHLVNEQSEQRSTVVQSKPMPSVKLNDYYAQQIAILDEQQRTGLSGLFLETQRVLKKFRPDALLIDVNFRFLETFEYWLRNVRNNKDTTISVKMRNLQRVMNLAIEDKLIKQEDYPFGEKKYSVNKRLDHTTKKIAIHTDKVAKLKALELKPGSSLHFAQQIFMFSYYSRGMNFIDITFLKWSDMPDNVINYVRRKTRGRFEIPVNPHIEAILNYFMTNYHVPGGYVFPILNDNIHITPKQKYTRKKTALKAVNDNLKKLAEMIGEPTLKLTTNVGRHSYATGLKRAGVNTAYITAALGHATQEQTQTYLDDFESGAIEQFEDQLFK
jgi:integrase/recombinase XerD